MHARTRWILLSVAGAAAVAVVWWRAVGEALPVESALVARGPYEETLVEDGRTRVRWHVDVTAPVTGEWTPADLRVGDTVVAGTVVGTLTAAPADPANARALTAQLGVAEADLSAARAAEAVAAAALAEAERSLGRTVRLGEAGGVTVEELERVRTMAEARQRERDAAEARVTAATFARDAARALLPGGGSTVRVTSPGAGVVLRLDEEHRRVVPAGTPLMMIGATGVLEVTVDVLSTDAGRVPVGARMLLLNGADSVAAHVLRVEPVAHTVRSALGVDEQRVSVVGDIHEPGALGHDFEVRARIVLSRREDALVVPSGALVREGDAWWVFAVGDDGRARRQAVTLISRGSEQAAVEGIAAGTRVVVHPPEALEEGTRVAY
jgi:HlyD family secretion protein